MLFDSSVGFIFPFFCSVLQAVDIRQIYDKFPEKKGGEFSAFLEQQRMDPESVSGIFLLDIVICNQLFLGDAPYYTLWKLVSTCIITLVLHVYLFGQRSLKETDSDFQCNFTHVLKWSLLCPFYPYMYMQVLQTL